MPGAATAAGSRRSERSASRGERASEGAVAFALAIGPGGVGLELADAALLGCIRVTELSTHFASMRFPIDVSGGVARFRHRRGQLQGLTIEIRGRDLERWIAPRLRGVVGARTPNVWIEVGPARASFCVSASEDTDAWEILRPAPAGAASREPSDGGPRHAPILAFDIHSLAEAEGLVVVVSNARGSALPEPPTALALACVEAALGSRARRTGAIFTLDRPAALVSFALFPGAGARVPSFDGVRWSAFSADAGTWILHAARDADAAAPSDDGLRAREAASLTMEADDALVRGQHDTARTLYVAALERAPRHADVSRRIVDIDARTPGRAEAALATLVESTARNPRAARDGAGFVTGELLAQVGDADAAIATFERAGESEPAPALAARAFELAARISADDEAVARCLDRALSLAPRSTAARRARVEARLSLGRLEDAIADVEHLEALAGGSRAKYAVWLAAGRAWDRHRLTVQAGAVFERALRFAPDDPRALAGLAVALLNDGREARGVSLLERALEIARLRGEPESSILLELARALAERLDDLPTAIAHAAAVSPSSADAAVARGLEGRWRARLGDLSGAALAFARLRDLAASWAPPAEASLDIAAVVNLLVEGAAMERDLRSDPLAAQRHLTVALRLLPHHIEARRAFRDVGIRLLRKASADLPHDDFEPSADVDEGDERESTAPMDPQRSAARARTMDLALEDDGASTDEDVRRAARVDELTRRLRDDPTNDVVADELTDLLAALERSHELVDLLWGRRAAAAPARRDELVARAQTIFERMVAASEAADRPTDAELYRDALAALQSR